MPKTKAPDTLPADFAGWDKPPDQETAPPAADTQKQPGEPGAISRAISSFGSALGAPPMLSDYIEGPKHLLEHPIDSISMLGKSMLQSNSDTARQGYSELKSGKIIPGLADMLYSGIPLIGPSLSKAGHQLESGDYAGGIGTTLGVAAPMLGGKILPAGSAAEAGTGGEASSLGNLPKKMAPEVSAREMTKAINPAVNEWPNFMKGTQAEAGNIIDYAKRNNINLKTQLDWAKAARGAADEANNHFKTQVLGPISKETASVAGTGYQGKGAGQASASLADINQRITDINDELRSAYNKRESGQTRTALAGEPELKAEKKALTDVLHNEIAKRTGLTPEQVANLRQRIGRQYSIADQTEAAVNQRESSEGKSIEGRRDIPLNKSGMVKSIVDYARGGSTGIADRRFSRIIPKMMSSSEPLPDMSGAMLRQRMDEVNAPTKRTPLWRTEGAQLNDRMSSINEPIIPAAIKGDTEGAPFRQRNAAKAEATKAKYTPTEQEKSGRLLPAKTGRPELPAITEENSGSSQPANWRLVRDPKTGQMKRQYLTSAGGSRK